mgnify:CR=1 FL=1
MTPNDRHDYIIRVKQAVQDGMQSPYADDAVVADSVVASLLAAGVLLVPLATSPRYIVRERIGKFRKYAVCDTSDRAQAWPGVDVAAFVERNDAEQACADLNARHK